MRPATRIYLNARSEEAMLLRKMKLGEELLIGGNIYIKAIESSRGGIRIGISAPREVQVTHIQGVAHQLSDYMSPRKAG